MKKYNLELKENDFFIILNLLYKERSLEVGLTPKFKKLSNIIGKFDNEYFTIK